MKKVVMFNYLHVESGRVLWCGEHWRAWRARTLGSRRSFYKTQVNNLVLLFCGSKLNSKKKLVRKDDGDYILSSHITFLINNIKLNHSQNDD